MRDRFNRKIEYLRISITDKCNLRCVYCRPQDLRNNRSNEGLNNDEIIRFVRIAHDLLGLRKVRITGGEPLIREDIISLIKGIKSIGIMELSLTTNGIRLYKMAGELRDAGLDRVNISLDTLKPDRYREITGGGDITQVFKSIDEAERVGLKPLKINMVPIRGVNDHEIIDFATLTLEKDYHIRFIEFMPAVCNIAWSRDKYINSKEILSIISSLGEVIKLPFRGMGPSRNYRIRGAKGIIGIISPLSNHFCNYCNRLRLTANGLIRPCLFSNTRIDIKTPMRAGASDEEIKRLLIKAIEIKPEGHSLDTRHPISIQSMSEIGG